MLTPDDIRQIARIRLAYKRLARYVAAADVDPGEPVAGRHARTIDDRYGHIATLVRQFLDGLGYGA